jgi:hypothetical protein
LDNNERVTSNNKLINNKLKQTMSSVTNHTSPMVTPTPEVDKTATLPDKMLENMAFGFWFLLTMKEDILSEDAYNKAFTDFLKPYASLEEQMSLYGSYERDSKLVLKALKQKINDHNKH